MKYYRILLFYLLFFSITVSLSQNNRRSIGNAEPLKSVASVTINDNFWKPKIDLWRKTTINDIFDKFEGKYDPQYDRHLLEDAENLGKTRNAFLNFDFVAEGERGTGLHYGPPWYDGLIYETIRGAADFLLHYPDNELENRIDSYINRIAAAQASDPDGYINTYTQLVEPNHRWGEHGGMLRWQHDVYNAGMLFEAGVHYYKATEKTKLLNVAVKFANYMCGIIGEAPKKNVVPAHSGPEEAIIKLYWLFKENPELKKEMDVSIDENYFYELGRFWIENRGKHCGLPLWETWGNKKAEEWIKAGTYMEPQYGGHSRPSWGSYAQDSIPVFRQATIEGHAVRATLMATGVTTAALENNDKRYVETASELWENMVGRRMFISGGVGAIAHDEKFGPDYYLPNDAYLETCAAVGAGFFSQRMNQLLGEGKYMDQFERVLYNGVLTGISQTGDHYTYENPLNDESHHRWNWHSCPCCPPMFLKIVSAIPEFIYSYRSNEVFVNMFVGSEAEINLENNKNVSITQTTDYPWDGKILLAVNPASPAEFTIKLRVPNWANGNENPFGLYKSDLNTGIVLEVNGEPVNISPVAGYISIRKTWKEGDKVELQLPMQPRFIYTSEEVEALNRMTAIASGPIVYCLEEHFNSGLDHLKIDTGSPMKIKYQPDLLEGINVITGQSVRNENSEVEFKAIPYYTVGNIKPGDAYKVWIPLKSRENSDVQDVGQ